MFGLDGVRCMLMRGGTSKGAFFVADDLPDAERERDEFLLAVMGSPDPRQIDGVGGAHPLTSKVAVVGASDHPAADVSYLFLQLGVDEPLVTDRQNCGNMLAGVGPFAVERDLVDAPDVGLATVRIHMANTDSIAVATFPVRKGQAVYSGDTAISGVPGHAAAVRIDFADTAGGSCGALLPTGNIVEEIDGVAVTLIDNGMPVVVMAAADVGVTGYESCGELEANEHLVAALESIRLEAGRRMNLGDVAHTTVPKLTVVSSAVAGGSLNTRTFIPHRCHDAIGVLGAVSVATAALLPGSPASAVLGDDHDGSGIIVVEHPTGTFDASVEVRFDADGTPVAERSGIVRTTRKLMDGVVYPREY
jgi:4-oxalomesaconate tautomerase